MAFGNQPGRLLVHANVRGQGSRVTHASMAKEVDRHSGGRSGGHIGQIMSLLARTGPVVVVAKDRMLRVLTGRRGEEEEGAWQVLKSSLQERCQASYVGR